jgi:hypothetical protein
LVGRVLVPRVVPLTMGMAACSCFMERSDQNDSSRQAWLAARGCQGKIERPACQTPNGSSGWVCLHPKLFPLDFSRPTQCGQGFQQRGERFGFRAPGTGRRSTWPRRRATAQRCAHRLSPPGAARSPSAAPAVPRGRAACNAPPAGSARSDLRARSSSVPKSPFPPPASRRGPLRSATRFAPDPVPGSPIDSIVSKPFILAPGFSFFASSTNAPRR